jgi:uncharacterized protein YheU (UPF0270 family)
MDFPDDELMERDGDATPVEVPWTALSPEALRGVIEAFVLREGTDYGASEVSHEEKLRQVHRELERGTARIMFDPGTSTVTLLPVR